MGDNQRKRVIRKRKSTRLDSPRLQPPAPRVTVVAVGPDSQPKPLGHGASTLDAVHFVQVGRRLVLAGTIDDLRAFVADMGMTVANMEHDMLADLVEEGRRRVRRDQRRLA